MHKVKIIFCLFLFVLSFLYVKEKINKIDIKGLVLKDDKTSLVTSIEKIKYESATNLNNEIKSSNKTKNKKNTNTKPLVYIYNSHDTESYKKESKNITPTVKTVSNILSKDLKKYNINSIVEEKSIKKGLDKYNLNYAGCYEISLMYLKEKKKKYPSLNYFFDIHRDSVKGKTSRVTINNKKYATIMFLLGMNHNNYNKNLSNIKIMESYLNKKYKGLLRSTYFQKKYQYNQSYSPNMFLVELGGPDNTLEEIYNSTKALSQAINYYLEVKNEK